MSGRRIAYITSFLVQVFPNVTELGERGHWMLKHVVCGKKISVHNLVRINVGSLQNKLIIESG